VLSRFPTKPAKIILFNEIASSKTWFLPIFARPLCGIDVLSLKNQTKINDEPHAVFCSGYGAAGSSPAENVARDSGSWRRMCAERLWV
jgi:hypothetical protein